MRILHVIDSGGLYGAEIMVLNLVAEQLQLGLHPQIASLNARPDQDKPFETEARRRGLPVRVVPMHSGPDLPGTLRLLAAARRDGVQLLHAHGYKANILLGMIPGRMRRLPLVSTLHGWTGGKGWNRMHLYQWLDARLLARADRVVLVSRQMLELPELRRLPAGLLTVIPNGLPARGESPAHLEQSPLGRFCQDGFCIGSIGRLSEEKGYLLLIEALHLLRDMIRDLRLVIIGEGPERRALERQIARFDLERRVLLPGYLPAAGDWLGCFDLYVNCSYTEGLPMTLLESMQAGVPIVATRVGGVPELLGEDEAGLLVEPGSSLQLAMAIEKLSLQPLLATRLAREARQRVNSSFSSRQMAERYAEVYAGVSGWRPAWAAAAAGGGP